MTPRRRGRGTVMLALLALVVLLTVGGYGLYLANMAGRLPWQEEPTRIPVTPFANLSGTDNDAETSEPPGTPVTGASGWFIGTLAYLDLTLASQSATKDVQAAHVSGEGPID